jgi:hypothetical protein
MQRKAEQWNCLGQASMIQRPVFMSKRKDLRQKRMREWLDHAVDSGLLKRKGRLLSYTSNAPDMDQQGFNFE